MQKSGGIMQMTESFGHACAHDNLSQTRLQTRSGRLRLHIFNGGHSACVCPQATLAVGLCRLWQKKKDHSKRCSVSTASCFDSPELLLPLEDKELQSNMNTGLELPCQLEEHRTTLQIQAL
jgi:hypothetical protein